MINTQKEGRVWALNAPLEVVTFDIYRDIHKGIRAELFGVTTAAGNVDPHDGTAIASLLQRFHALVGLLDGHAAHEDRYLTPLIQRQSGALAGAITQDHRTLEAQLHQLASTLQNVPSSRSEQRLAVHRFYLSMASFTSDYLEHQALEELEVMPALAAGYTVQDLLHVNAEILAEIPPETMAASLSLLLPAMNVDDRVEMLSGIKATAPPQGFAAVLGLAAAVLPPADYAALAALTDNTVAA